MTNDCGLLEFDVQQGGSFSYVALLAKQDGTPVVFADVESITGVLVAADGTQQSFDVDPSLTIFNDLVITDNDRLWPYGGGYNFLHVVAGTLIPSATDYTLQYRIDLVDGVTIIKPSRVSLHVLPSIV